jgi:hypothetical protein
MQRRHDQGERGERGDRTRETVSMLGVVAGSATETRASAEAVLTASAAVATAAKALRADLEEFLRAIAA